MSVALVIPAALWKPVGVASQQVVLRGNYKESHPVCLARRASVGAMAKKIWHNSSCNQLGLVLDCLPGIYATPNLCLATQGPHSHSIED